MSGSSPDVLCAADVVNRLVHQVYLPRKEVDGQAVERGLQLVRVKEAVMITNTVQHQHRWLTALAAAAMSAILSLPTHAAADTWNERTELTFSEPVMIPGATLQPGTYIFKLADSRGSRHMVQVFKADSREPIALTQAVPIRRPTEQRDTILTFNPTEGGIPALKAWYYPYSTYGHEFIYPEEQARQIAERSKTVVLSVDVNGTDMEKGTLHLYHPEGNRSEWRADAAIDKEWAAWQRQRATNADEDDDHGDTGNGHSEARAPMMMTNAPATRVEIEDIESNPAKFRGTTVSVDGEVEEVYGPRLFTIDEPHWGDLDGEVLVYAPSMLAALVKDDDRITVTGTLKSVAVADIEREWGWFELDPEIEVEFLKKPVLIADRIVGGDNNVALFLDMNGKSAPAGGSAAIMDAALLGEGTTDLVGRSVDLKNVTVLRMAPDEGFFVDVTGGAVLVLPDRNVPVTVKPGDTVSILGAVAALPDRTAERVNPPSDWNPHIYIVATTVSK